MRILWFTNSKSNYVPSRQMADGIGGYNGGEWIASAEKLIKSSTEIELAVSFIMDGQPEKVVQDGVTYYPMRNPVRASTKERAKKLFHAVSGYRILDYEKSLWQPFVDGYLKVINDFNPNVIHIWGSEREYGLVARYTKIPVILHVQGILRPVLNAFLPPCVSWHNYKYASLNPSRLVSTLMNKSLMEMAAYRESVIMKNIKFYLGRTEWDKRVINVYCEDAKYSVVNEVLRDEFYTTEARSVPEKLTIVTTIGSPLYKGFDIVLKTAKLLKEEYKLEFEWNCYGNIETEVFQRNTGINPSDVNVHLLGVAKASILRDAELKASMYVHSSYIDNSPNSICEAQMLGLPVVTTNVGGIPSLVKDGVTGYLVPSNDPYQMAYCIKTLFMDKGLNVRMGMLAKVEAINRHSKQLIKDQILSVYKSIV